MSELQATASGAPAEVGTGNPWQNFNLKDVWASPGMRQLAALIGVALAVALGVTIFFWAQKPNMQTLYSGLTEQDAAAMSESLREAGIEFKHSPGSGDLLVSAADLQRARMHLAGQGLPRSAGSGFEMMREEQGIGVSQFLENARYQHALETELARTISQLQPVRSARVHLAIPQRSAFVRASKAASASVLIALYPGRRLEKGQVDAIVHLVSSSIPDMLASDVSVVDEAGRLLSNASDSGMALSASQLEYRNRVEDNYRQRIEQLLLPVLGVGRVSAQVNVDMDFSALEETSETYAPQGRVIRSEQISEDRDASADAVGVPGALSNRVPDQNGQQAGNAAGRSSSQQVRNYEVDRNTSRRRSDPGRIERVTVAVLVDNMPVVAEEGEAPTNQPLSQERLTQIEGLVKNAVGFDAQRGDSVTVSNLSFIDAEAVPEMDTPIWEQPMLRDILRQVLGAGVLLVIAFLILRPALKSALNPTIQVAAIPPAAIGGGAAGTSAPAAAMQQQEEADFAPAKVPPIEKKINVARQAAAQDPKKVAQLMKQWVGDE